MIEITRLDAIRSLFRELYDRASSDQIHWKDGHETTADETTQIDAELLRLQAEYDSQEYARLRQVDYPSIQDCLHAILDDDLEALQVKRQEVKNRYPKP